MSIEQRCGHCGSPNINLSHLGLMSCWDCGFYQTETGWKSLEELTPAEREPKFVKANRPITEEYAEHWWNSRTPEGRYRDMSYSGWSAATINHEGGPFTGDWKSQPLDVRESILLGMRQGSYIKM
jgi:hypothetical protein